MRTTKKMALTAAAVLIAIIMLTGMQASAAPGEGELDDIEYTSEDIPTEKLEQIIKAMYGIDDEPERGNIFCIFGHSKATGIAKIIEHRYYPAAPKCRETNSYIEYCTRSGCDYFVVIAQSSGRIVCCP